MKKVFIILLLLLLLCSTTFGAYQNFGIYSPTLGLREDFPSIFIKKAFHPDHKNIRIQYGEVWRSKGRVKEFLDTLVGVQAPEKVLAIDTAATGTEIFTHNSADETANFVAGTSFRVMDSSDNDAVWTVSSSEFTGGNTEVTVTGNITDDTGDGYMYVGTSPIIHYHRHIDNTDTQKILVFTKDYVFEWIDSTDKLTLRWDFYASPDATHWDTETFQNLVIMTNGINKIRKWASGDDEVSVLDTASGLEITTGPSTYVTVAKHLAQYANYLIIGYTTEGGGTFPQRLRFCDIAQAAAWDSGDAGAIDIVGSDFIAEFGKYQSYFVIFKERSIHRMWNVRSTDIFNLAPITQARNLGTITPGSIINDQLGNLYYMANDFTIRSISLQEISAPVDKILKAINPTTTYIQAIHSAYIDEYGELWWTIPSGSGQTSNNKIIKFNPESGVWSSESFPVRSFGRYQQEAGTDYTWDTLPATWTWDTWDWDMWDIRSTQAGFVPDIGSDYSGNTFELHASTLTDNTAAYEGYFILTTDFADKSALPFFKRWLSTQIYVRSETTGILSVQVKRDNESSWQNVGSVSLVGSDDILILDLPCDVRAKTFDVKFTATNHFQFLGVVFKFIPDGLR